ncbi:uncharacterized protein YALI1_C25515g [Yarrowia lipolytica]|uniref:Uncharacterized protein n=1 Tax=Yarrowia lipolytica TaxID=4952 RepID=A0A1D8NBN6_YARLL|nr:hypothetical protein YALI1_C25515g [Yarrowia lipolytica]
MGNFCPSSVPSVATVSQSPTQLSARISLPQNWDKGPNYLELLRLGFGPGTADRSRHTLFLQCVRFLVLSAHSIWRYRSSCFSITLSFIRPEAQH